MTIELFRVGALLLTLEIIRSKDVSASRSEACVPKECGVGVGASRKGEVLESEDLVVFV